jgi:hypothetical protein
MSQIQSCRWTHRYAVMFGRNAISNECEEGIVFIVQDEAKEKKRNLVEIYLLYLKIILFAYNF